MTYYMQKCLTLLSIIVCSIVLLAGCQQRSADEAGSSSGGSSMGGTESGDAAKSGSTPSSGGGLSGSGESGGISGGASSALDRAENSDTAITARVKAALLRDSKVKGTDISVETRQGEVILSGFVDQSTQVDEAMKVARGVDGVKTVTNKMKSRQ